VAGTLHRDDITTPHGRATSLGGSAVYFALAAARHTRVHLNGIVGLDTVSGFRAMFHGLPIDTSGLMVSRTPTFLWHAVHDFDRWVTSSESEDPGCDPEWHPLLDVASRNAEVLFLGSMHPRFQREVLDQAGARLVGADSMTVHMREDSASVRSIATASDILFLNNEEIELLAGRSGWREAALAMCASGRPRAVVVKQGPDGAACVMRDRVFEIAAPAVEHVLDPTGAGDALAGGFLGLCARFERADAAFFEDALAEGVRCAAAAVSTFGTAGLATLANAGARRPADV
jgi:sugar/nucleoside kinase (ribokinase family)